MYYDIYTLKFKTTLPNCQTEKHCQGRYKTDIFTLSLRPTYFLVDESDGYRVGGTSERLDDFVF